MTDPQALQEENARQGALIREQGAEIDRLRALLLQLTTERDELARQLEAIDNWAREFNQKWEAAEAEAKVRAALRAEAEA